MELKVILAVVLCPIKKISKYMCTSTLPVVTCIIILMFAVHLFNHLYLSLKYLYGQVKLYRIHF